MTPSIAIAACVPELVSVPAPFEYVAVKLAVVATRTEALTSNPFATLSTYALLVSESAVNPERPCNQKVPLLFLFREE